MRTIGANSEAVLSGSSRSEHLKVKIKDSGGTWIDYTDLEGLNWIESASWGDGEEAPTMTSNVQFRREKDLLSLAPFMQGSKLNQLTGSYVPLIALQREIEIFEAVVPIETNPVDEDWKSVFLGNINKTNTIGGLSLECRDPGGILLDTFIEEQREYGDAVGVDVEDVMQDILDDNGLSSVVLWTPTSPGWKILSIPDATFILNKQPVMTALRMLADQIGWIVKYRYDEGTNAWRLKFYEPDRTVAGGSNRTFSPGEYKKIGQSAQSSENVRNKWRGVYTDIADGKRKTEEVSDSASITKYGLKFAEISEDDNGNINTSAEILRFINTALADTKDPDLIQSIEMESFWPVETGDVYDFEADGENYDTTQTLAVKSWQTKWAKGSADTVLNVAGKPGSGVLNWIRKEATPGNKPSADFIGPVRPNQVTRFLADRARGGLGPLLINGSTERSTLVPNADFGALSRVTTGSGWPPDAWSMSNAAIWGPSDDVFISTSVIKNGEQSLHFRAKGTTKEVKSNLFPVTEGDLYQGSAFLWSDSGDTGDVQESWIQYYLSDGVTTVGAPAFIFGGRAFGSVWVQINLKFFLVPATAKRARIFIKQTPSTAHNLYVDSILFSRSLTSFWVWRNANLSLGSGAWQKLDYNQKKYDYSTAFDLPTDVFQAPYTGLYGFKATCVLQAPFAASYFALRFLKNGATLEESDSRWTATAAMFTQVSLNLQSVLLNVGDQIQCDGFQSGVAARTIAGLPLDPTAFYFSGQQITRVQ